MKFKLKLMGKIILRFSSSPDRSINTLAYNQLNYNGAFHLTIIKITSLHLICIYCLRYARNVKRGDGRCHMYVNENYPQGSSFMQEVTKPKRKRELVGSLSIVHNSQYQWKSTRNFIHVTRIYLRKFSDKVRQIFHISTRWKSWQIMPKLLITH